MLFPVMRDINEIRKHQMKQWKTIPEDRRPTWEQFKRGLQPHPGSPLANFQAQLEKLSEISA
jgi:hypothetical protein